MFYNEIDFDEAFPNPPSIYRGTPFWAWNTDLNEEVLEEQIQVFKEMGFGGFHIHSRIGLNTQYLGKRFLELVKYCNQVGKQKEMLTWLYDEDKWPSGFGGGLVTCNKEFRIRYLLMSPHFHEDGSFKRNVPAASRVNIDGDINYLCSYRIRLSQGFLSSYEQVDKTAVIQGEDQIWHAYRVISGDTSWFNNQAYVDTLNPKAIEKFTQVTHDVYDSILHDEFGKSVFTMFTDEPQYFKMQNLSASTDKIEVGIPYTDALDDDFQAQYGMSLFACLPEIFWERENGQLSVTRYRYFDTLSERFANAYAGTLDTWCKEHSLLSTGHLMGEPTLDLQTRLCGEALRSYRSFQLPGIDMLANSYEYMTAKQAQSACHQYGRPGVLSELYGVTNWDFDFRGHKLQGDWQAALGVTVRVPHLSWATMAGEAKRDYPAPIDQHSPWYLEYREIEDHFSRVNLALTRGNPVVHIGVLHPIESYWVSFGPDDKTAAIRKNLETQFENLATWLLFGQLDYDYIAESQFPILYEGCSNRRCKVGKIQYEVLLVPGLLTIRNSTLEILEAFVKEGGKVVFMGNIPSYVDALPNPAAKQLAEQCEQIGFDQWELSTSLHEVREVELVDHNSVLSTDLIYQLREEDDNRWLFIAHGREKSQIQQENFRDEVSFATTIRLRGAYEVIHYNTYTGEKKRLSSKIQDGWTQVCYSLYAHDSLLLKFQKPENSQAIKMEQQEPRTLVQTKVLGKVDSYSMEEPNLLLLDQAEFSLDGGDWQPVEEILRLDDSVRKECGYPLRSEAFPQPWLTGEDTAKPHLVNLRFTFESEFAGIPVKLACETPEAVLVWNGVRLPLQSSVEFFVDKCLQVRSLGPLVQGKNILELAIPFGRKTNLEWHYLLGDFGVRLEGAQAFLTSKSETLFFGDLTRQALPFYGGNITYSIQAIAQEGYWVIKVPHYVGSLLTVSLDGEKRGQIVGEPYTLDLGKVEGEEHLIEINFFGTRFNTFGQLHNCNKHEAYFGPASWRSKLEEWTYTYQVRPTGVLTEPLLFVYR